MKSLIACKSICTALVLLAASAVSAPAQIVTNIAFFDTTNGAAPAGSLIQGTDGKLYGTTNGGGENGAGTIFSVTPDGTLTAFYSFCTKPNCADGFESMGALALGTDGNFYGTTFAGGAEGFCNSLNGCGTIFKLTPNGVFTVLHRFKGPDGEQPGGGLAFGSDGNLYGTAEGGGANSCFCGTVFRITSAGAFTVLHSFDGNGAFPSAALIQGTDGNFYGTTYEGGNSGACLGGCGAVFKVTAGGVFTLLHSLDLTDGEEPAAPLLQASNGIFYGTTFEGGKTGLGEIFRISPAGTFAPVHNFHINDGGAGNSLSGLIQATDGNLYGASPDGGFSAGELFKLALPGTVTSLYSFNPANCGGGYTALFQATDGKLYGSDGCAPSGAIFTLDMGLGPFVAFVIPTGKAGQSAQILGQGFTGTSSVTFNGVQATSFKVVSDTFMTAVVPSAATTGPVVVTTPGGALTSNVNFRIAK